MRIGIILTCCLLWGLFLLPGCGSAQKPEEKKTPGAEAPPPEVADMLAEPEGELPALPKASAYATKLTEPKLEPLPASDEAVTLRWDFSQADKIYAYDFQQQVENSSTMGNSPTPMKQNIKGDGKLLMKSQGGGAARLVLKDLQMSTSMTAMGQSNQMGMQEMPPVVMQGVKENSAIESDIGGMGEMLKHLFPLPPEPIKVGETVKLPADLPFNAMGSNLKVEGHVALTLKRLVKLHGRRHAELRAVIDISKLEVPAEMQGEYHSNAVGEALYYFDLEHRCFESAQVALVMGVRVDAPIPQFNLPKGGNFPKVNLPKTQRMVMDGDNLITIARNPDLEKAQAAEDAKQKAKVKEEEEEEEEEAAEQE